MKKNNGFKVFCFILVTFIVFFLALIFAEASGYYETKQSRNKSLTEEQIKVFEEDIKNGKQIDITDYMKDNTKNYSTNLSNNVYKISLKLEKAVDNTIKLIFNKMSDSINN